MSSKMIWFWMRNCQQVFVHWANIKDLITFANYLPAKEREALLITFSAICWKARNEVIFKDAQVLTGRNLIVLICSLLNYWTALMPADVKRCMSRWMPQSMEEIPLQVLPPILMIAG